VLAILALVMMAMVVAAVVAAAAFVIRAAFWLILLPIRLVFALLFVPFWIARMVLKVTVGAILLPVVMVGGLIVAAIAAVAALIAVVTPLLPLLLVGVLIWLVLRSFRPATA
jgi:hypothetical protein